MQKLTDYSRLLTRIIITSLFLMLFMTVVAEDFNKTYKEKYDVDKGASMVIRNKFGDIHCQAWDESSVDITVTIKVDAFSQEKANRVFEKIDVELGGTRTKVEGITTVGSISNADFSIDYNIRMPRWINIDLDNKFGDIYLDEADGMVKINLEYGAMEANSGPGAARRSWRAPTAGSSTPRGSPTRSHSPTRTGPSSMHWSAGRRSAACAGSCSLATMPAASPASV